MIAKGYKQTEVGVIPEDWDDREIGLICKITTGSKDTQDKVKEGKYPFYVRSNTVERINSYSFDGEAVLTSGDGVGVGKIFHYLNCKFDYHQRVYKIYGFNETINGKYFFYQFSTNFYDRVMSMTAKSSVDSVRKEMISEMKIPLPPTLKEQEAIAKVLTDTDNLIQGIEDLIAKKKAIKKGAMQQLLTPPNKGGKRLPGFSGEWEKTEIGDLFTIMAGGDIDRDNFSRLKRDDFIYNIYANSLINKGHYGYTRIAKFKAKSITVTARGSLGKAEYRDEPFDAIVRLIVLEPKFKLKGFYFSEYINSKIEFAYESTGVPQLTAPQISKYIICHPKKYEEQEAIATILSDMDKEIEALEVKKEKYIQVKKGLAQELLTGKTRLV